MSENPEPLSLATFEPDRAFPPYLNTPRSLEACRLNGVNPIELVEIPVTEFQKDFPNDPDGAQRRFERHDAARRRVLAKATEDWKQLVAKNWIPTKKRPVKSKEAIMVVPQETHSTMLELQAAMFRKLERDNYLALQRTLKIELKNAQKELEGKQILQKHDAIQNANDGNKRALQEKRVALAKQKIEDARIAEEERMREVRRLQEMDAAMAQEKKEREIMRRKMEKQRNEQREMERVQREQYTKQMKDTIMKGVNDQIDSKKRIQELRDKNTAQRLAEEKAARDKRLEDKHRAEEERARRVREETARRDEEERAMIAQKLAEQDDYRRRKEEADKMIGSSNKEQSDRETRDKLNKLIEQKTKIEQDKIEKTKRALELKEQLARQEMAKVQAAQNKRRNIKAIRQEAYDIAYARTQKANEYRMQKLNKDIADKEQRSQNIKQGFNMLNQMRNSMKDIMTSTTLQLKHEMHHLRHKDQFNPDNVVESAVHVTDKVLFPRLKKTFGLDETEEKDNGWSQQFPSSDVFPADTFKPGSSSSSSKPGSRAGSKPGTGTGSRPKTPQPSLDNYVNEKAAADEAAANAIPDHNVSRSGQFSTLPIKTMTMSHLKEDLTVTKKRMEAPIDPATVYGTSPGKSRTGNRSPDKFRTQRRQHKDSDYYDDDDNNNMSQSHGSQGKGPVAILKLEKEEDKEEEDRSANRRGHHSSNNSADNGSAGRLNDDRSRPPFKRHDADDVDLPMSNFKGQEEFDADTQQRRRKEEKDLESKRGDNTEDDDLNLEFNPDVGGGAKLRKKSPQKLSAMKKPPIRTDVNEKAHFLEAPEGKFRREMSKDHPLAAGGKGKYEKELEAGVTPVGMDMTQELKRKQEMQAKGNTNKKSNNDSLAYANTVQKLTYDAEAKVVDPEQTLEKLRKAQNESLKKLIEEERRAEEARETASKELGNTDPTERFRLEQIFAEERHRASDRIINATRRNEQSMREAMLALMNLRA